MIIEPLQLIVTTAFGPSQPDTGLPAEVISAGETRLGVKLPEALKNYYSVAGNAYTMMRTDFNVQRPDQLRIDGKHLVFLEENQSTAEWGISLDALAKFPNPGVDGRASQSKKWFSESSQLSAFLLAIGAWQAVMAQGEKARCKVPEEEFEKVESLLEYIGDEELRFGALRVGLIDRKNALLATYLYITETLYIGSPNEGAVEDFEKRSGLDFDAL